jgi:alkanesulfonate monooxygenase SsuD/methylene tetrahydromethanopterin reductase-like flavin-dependent oxidoreductase (luciferase family)
MSLNRIGIEVPGRSAAEVLARIDRAEQLGIHAVWLTTGGTAVAGGGVRRDSFALLAAAAARTQRVLLGPAIALTWPRHPLALFEYAHIMAQIAPGRFRLGIGPGSKAAIERAYGVEFTAPLGHLSEYLRILKAMLGEGAVGFDGRYYRAHARADGPVDVPVMISAVRRRSFELAGAEADGAISWICPGAYLRDVALPALRKGAKQAGRSAPPLVAHAVVCVHQDQEEVRAAARERFQMYMSVTSYTEMFTEAGFPEVRQGSWSDRMLEAIVLSGSEAQVAGRLRELLSLGATELMLTPLAAGTDREASLDRTLRLVAQAAQSLTA